MDQQARTPDYDDNAAHEALWASSAASSDGAGDAPPASDPPYAPSAAPEPAELDFLTPEMARKAKEQRDRGYIFPLPHTGGKAHVRKLTLAERSVVGQLEPLMQRKILQALTETARQTSALKGDGSIDMGQAMGNLRRNEDAINLVCVAGFIRPRLKLNETGDPNAVLVTDIDINDRAAYYRFCEGSESELRRLEPFLG